MEYYPEKVNSKIENNQDFTAKQCLVYLDKLALELKHEYSGKETLCKCYRVAWEKLKEDVNDPYYVYILARFADLTFCFDKLEGNMLFRELGLKVPKNGIIQIAVSQNLIDYSGDIKTGLQRLEKMKMLGAEPVSLVDEAISLLKQGNLQKYKSLLDNANRELLSSRQSTSVLMDWVSTTPDQSLSYNNMLKVLGSCFSSSGSHFMSRATSVSLNVESNAQILANPQEKSMSKPVEKPLRELENTLPTKSLIVSGAKSKGIDDCLRKPDRPGNQSSQVKSKRGLREQPWSVPVSEVQKSSVHPHTALSNLPQKDERTEEVLEMVPSQTEIKLSKENSYTTKKSVGKINVELKSVVAPPKLSGYEQQTTRSLHLPPMKKVQSETKPVDQVKRVAHPKLQERPQMPVPKTQTNELSISPQVNTKNSQEQTGSSDSVVVNGVYYRVIDMLGTGGFSKVYLVLNNKNQQFALKVVNLSQQPGRNAPTPHLINSLRKEIDLLKRLGDTGRVVKLYDSEENSKQILMVMEKADVDFQKLFGKSGLKDDVKISFYWKEMLLCVSALHAEGVVHLDLKPANFVLVRGTPKLIDLGISRELPDDVTSVVSDECLGTVSYMSPEQLDGAPALQSTEEDTEDGRSAERLRIGRKSDVWSMGCILYSMVYGKTPFAKYTNLLMRAKAICDPNFRITYPDGVNPRFVAIMKRCLVWNKEERASVDELLSVSCETPPAAGARSLSQTCLGDLSSALDTASPRSKEVLLNEIQAMLKSKMIPK